MSRNKITKDTIPEGFSISLAIYDFVPVLLFGLCAVKIGSLFHSAVFIAGAVICSLSGVVKVLWKLIAAMRKKNIWPLFFQMRIFMPVGFAIMLIALFVDRANLNAAAIIAGLTGAPACVFFAMGVLGMLLMCVFAVRLDSSDARSNFIEQTTNSIAQLCFFIGLLLVR